MYVPRATYIEVKSNTGIILAANMSMDNHPGTPTPKPTAFSPFRLPLTSSMRPFEEDESVFNPTSTSTPGDSRRSASAGLQTHLLSQSPYNPLLGWLDRNALVTEMLDDDSSLTVASIGQESPVARLVDRPLVPSEPIVAATHRNIGRERRTPDVTVFITRNGSLSLNLPVGVIELKPVRTQKVSKVIFHGALTQACEQAQFVFQKSRDRVTRLHILVIVGEAFQYGGSVTPMSFDSVPLPDGPLKEEANIRLDSFNAESVLEQHPICNIWVDESRKQFTPEFSETYQTIFGQVKTQFTKFRPQST